MLDRKDFLTRRIGAERVDKQRTEDAAEFHMHFLSLKFPKYQQAIMRPVMPQARLNVMIGNVFRT
jgi:hypothetical protein